MNPRLNTFNNGEDNIRRFEFPLLQWEIAQFERWLGEDIVIVKVFVFLIGLLVIFTFFGIIRDQFGDTLTAGFSAVFLLYSPLFYYYTICPMPDMLALAFGFIYVLFILRHRKSQRRFDLVAASIALSLAALCKLPFLMYSILSIFFFFQGLSERKEFVRRLKTYALPQFLFLIPAFAWYIWVIPTWGANPVLTGHLDEGIDFQEYAKILKYHGGVMFPQILLSLPIWLLLLYGTYYFFKSWRNYKWVLYLALITFLYLMLELKPIGVIHDYYMFPFLIWLYTLVAIGVFHALKYKHGKYIIMLLCITSAIFTAQVSKVNWSLSKTYFNEDVYNYSEELKKAVPQTERCIILNDVSSFMFSYRIDKMGYVFNVDKLDIDWIDDLVRNHDVRYMYSDSRNTDTADSFQPYIKRLITQKGSVKVFELELPSSSAQKTDPS